MLSLKLWLQQTIEKHQRLPQSAKQRIISTSDNGLSRYIHFFWSLCLGYFYQCQNLVADFKDTYFIKWAFICSFIFLSRYLLLHGTVCFNSVGHKAVAEVMVGHCFYIFMEYVNKRYYKALTWQSTQTFAWGPFPFLLIIWKYKRLNDLT